MRLKPAFNTALELVDSGLARNMHAVLYRSQAYRTPDARRQRLNRHRVNGLCLN